MGMTTQLVYLRYRRSSHVRMSVFMFREYGWDTRLAAETPSSCLKSILFFFFFSSRRRHTRYWRDWSSDVCSSDLTKKIIFASSGATYGTPDEVPVNEETPQRPESPYGITKLVAEYYLRYWYEANGLRYTALRYGNVYGPRQDPNGEAGVIAIFAKHILAHEPVRID